MNSSITSSDTAATGANMRYRHYLAAFAAVWAMAALPLAGNAFFLWRQGEFISLPDVVRQQWNGNTSSPLRYGTAVHADTAAYKAELWRQAPAQVVALGSSRVMQFRQEQFRVPFLNLGGTVGPASAGRKRAATWFANDAPKLVLLGVDFWWLVWEESRFAALEHGEETRRFRPDLLVQPTEWLWNGRLTSKEYFATLSGQPATYPGIGVKARLRGTGFSPDGSYHYSPPGVLAPQVGAKQLQVAAREIRDGLGRFTHATTPHPEDMAELFGLIADLQAKGATVVVFLPPLPAAVYAELQAHPKEFEYIDGFLTEARRLGVTCHNLHDPASVGAVDDDFVDDYHGGSPLAAKVLATLAKRDPAVAEILAIPPITNKQF
jgi:hypothetical protein